MMRGSRLLRLVLATALLALVPAMAAGSAHALVPARTTYAQIEGSGSTWSQVIVNQWISDVDALGMRVTYSGGGSSQGRKDFANNVTDFGISEIPYAGVDELGNPDNSNGRDFAYLPIVAGGTAFTYQLKVGNEQVRNLRLSGETLAKIFTNEITDWSDPEIAKDNNGRKFPALPITPVVRSDGSGTTAQFTTWMNAQYASIWQGFYGKNSFTSYYPRKGRAVAAAGSDQVMNTISGFAGNGTIGYVEYSYPVNKHYPVVKVLNKGGYYVEPTQYNVAVALTKAKINNDPSSQMYLTQILDGVYNATDPRAYPLSSYSYMLIPTGADDQRMSTAKRQTLADFMFYSLCEGQSKAGPYGYSPLPLNLVKAGFSQLAKLKAADPAVDITNRDVTKCHNPTFVSGNLGRNRLAEIAPQPEACDKQGEGPCGYDTGTAPTTATTTTSGATTKGDGKGDQTDATTTTDGGGTDPGTTSDPGGGSDPATGEAPAAVDPETGEAVGSGSTQTAPDGTSVQSGEAIYANPITLSSSRPGDGATFGWVAVLELLALVLLPGIFVATRRRRTSGSPR